MVFTYKLELEDGAPADPPTIRSAPGVTWKPGDTIPLGKRTLRVVGGAGASDSLGAGFALAVPTGIDCRSREGRVPAGDAQLDDHSGVQWGTLVVCLSSHSRQNVCLATGRAGAG